MTIISLNNITQVYGDNKILEDISIKFGAPGINMLLGPSGSGKSTLLKMVGGVRPFGVTTPTSGKVMIDGKECFTQHDDAVMVFQHYVNRPDLTVYQNVYFPFTLKLWREKVSPNEARERTEAILTAVGLHDKKDLRPAQLSGGQNQRVALARALVLRPRILLMDEPFGALDAQTRENMQILLANLYKQYPCVVLFVTHDVTEALILGDRVIVLSTKPAKVVEDFTIPEPRETRNVSSGQFKYLEEKILAKLHSATGKGQVRVSV